MQSLLYSFNISVSLTGSENILIDATGNVSVKASAKCAKALALTGRDDTYMSHDGKNFQWHAPEAVMGGQRAMYTPENDVFCFGVIMWEVMTGICPIDGDNYMTRSSSWPNMDSTMLLEHLVKRNKLAVQEILRLHGKATSNLVQRLKSIVVRCLLTNPARRPDFKGILQETFGQSTNTAVYA
jgi:serine/threonine protein kinase